MRTAARTYTLISGTDALRVRKFNRQRRAGIDRLEIRVKFSSRRNNHVVEFMNLYTY